MSKDDWMTSPLWRQQIERRLYDVVSQVKGMGPAHADRIADVVEQIHELRLQLQATEERIDKMKEWILAHVPKTNGNTGGQR